MVAAVAMSVALVGASPAFALVNEGGHITVADASAAQHSTTIVNNAKEVGYAGVAASDVSAASTEEDLATPGTPSTTISGCTSGHGLEICFEKYGDRIWVNNTNSILGWGYWSNWLRDANGKWVKYRSGTCSPLYNGWESCNKNFYEDTTKNAVGGHGSGLRLYACNYEGCTSYYGWVRNDS